ncbi:hypothetical protein ACFZDG_22240 [Kitasatospora xanthocidica]|uniref:hypothetical protein n=1 Tax=Kitasatospora xanthocidica TaxID=83382 RepID=UPI0036E2AD92
MPTNPGSPERPHSPLVTEAPEPEPPRPEPSVEASRRPHSPLVTESPDPDPTGALTTDQGDRVDDTHK